MPELADKLSEFYDLASDNEARINGQAVESDLRILVYRGITPPSVLP